MKAVKEEDDYEYMFNIKGDLLRFLEMIRKQKDSFEIEIFSEQLGSIENFLEPLLGFDNACD